MKDYDLEELKKLLPEYARQNLKPDRKVKKMYVCPFCGSGSRGSRNSDGAFSISPSGKAWSCFSCNAHGDIFDLVKRLEGIENFADVKKRVAAFGNIPLPEGGNQAAARCDVATGRKEPQAAPEEAAGPSPEYARKCREYIYRCHADVGATEYFHKRGFTDETIERFKLGYDVEKKAVVIPYDGKNGYFITRSTERKEFRKPSGQEAGPEPIYNAAAMYRKKPCFVCESQLDAVSIMQAGGAALAIGGTNGVNKLKAAAKERAPECTLVLCFDNDEPGRKAADSCAEALESIGVSYIQAKFDYASYGSPDYIAPVKDANDLLRADPDRFRRDIRANARKARHKTGFTAYPVSSYLRSGVFEEDIDYFRTYKGRKTGFSNIDPYLTLYPGLAALGGSASLGKSTFAMNLADNLLKAGESVLYFALEQEPIELVTKSLARRLYEKDPFCRITNVDIKNGATSEALEAVKKEYEAAAGKFTIVRCNFETTAEEIRDYIYRHIETTNEKPVIFIDYLQLVSPPKNFRGDVRAVTDHVIKTFKAMQLEHELFVCVISNFNRNSYMNPVSYESFKESGMIEFTCDYVWGLQLSVLDSENFYTVTGRNGSDKESTVKHKRDILYSASIENPKRVEFVSLKSRNGKQSFKAFFRYRMEYDIFEPEKKPEFEDAEEEDIPDVFKKTPVV